MEGSGFLHDSELDVDDVVRKFRHLIHEDTTDASRFQQLAAQSLFHIPVESDDSSMCIPKGALVNAQKEFELQDSWDGEPRRVSHGDDTALSSLHQTLFFI